MLCSSLQSVLVKDIYARRWFNSSIHALNKHIIFVLETGYLFTLPNNWKGDNYMFETNFPAFW